jgi:transmembrane sensor
MDNRLEELFNRYYQGLATASEKEELMAFIRSTKDNAVLEKFLKNGWGNLDLEENIFTAKKSNAMLSSILDSAPKEEKETKIVSIGWLRYASAAAIFILIGLGIWWKIASDPATEIAQTAQPKTEDVKPGGAKALLTLSDGSAIELASAKSGFLTRQGAAEVSKSQDGVLVYNAKPGNVTSQNQHEHARHAQRRPV